MTTPGQERGTALATAAAANADFGRRVTILGSTGSIGCNTLDLIAMHREAEGGDAYPVEALTANRNVDLLIEQARSFRPRLAVIGDEAQYGILKDGLSGTGIEVAAGPQALCEAAAAEAEWVMAAIVGAAGLKPTLEAVRRGADVALANKECLVCAGPLMVEELRRSDARLLPVDSEHNAIFQVFEFESAAAIERIILTASGGPFRSWAKDDMAAVTPEQAVAHPNWSMGAKISVDSATMMNKGLELIEAFYLFPLAEDRIEILVHPQSIIHSMVGYADGSILAQLGSPDMRTPIAHTLAWPARIGS
ncbi:MAG: 1-deoxy-D-xylulose-5-phosphate reductoisomerase, partial [Alphaproteobacteria bacterium]